MGTRREEFRIVQVVSHCRLLDSDAEEHIYWRRNGLGVEVGWYGVTWPLGEIHDRFDEATVFHGPYATRAQALSAMTMSGVGKTVNHAPDASFPDYFAPPPDSRAEPF